MTQTKFVALALICSALVTQAAEISFFSTNATWRWLRGTNEASAPDASSWRSNSFNDAAFADAPAPFTYGEGYPNGTALTDMINTYSCIFLCARSWSRMSPSFPRCVSARRWMTAT